MNGAIGLPATRKPAQMQGLGPGPSVPAGARRRTQYGHGAIRTDEYGWLEGGGPEVASQLEREREFGERVLTELATLRSVLSAEFADVELAGELSLARREGGFAYWSQPGPSGFRRHVRRSAADPAAAVEVLVDEAAFRREYVHVGSVEADPSGSSIAYTVDLVGDERYELRVRDAGSDEDRLTTAACLHPRIAYADGTVYACELNQAGRPWRVVRFAVSAGAHPSTVPVLQVPDERFFLNLRRTKSRRYLLIVAESRDTTALHTLGFDPNDSTTPLELLVPEAGLTASADHVNGRWVVLTTDDAHRQRLLQSDDQPLRWAELALPSGCHVESFELFDDHIVLFGHDGLSQVVLVHSTADGAWRRHELPEEVTRIEPADNPDPSAARVRFRCISATSPDAVWECALRSGSLTLVTRGAAPRRSQEVRVVSYRIHARAADGTVVPTTVLHRSDLPRDGTSPCLVIGYGAYGVALAPAFAAFRLPLLERGLVFAFTHVRGGGELGPAWHRDGARRNAGCSVTDFLACVDELIDRGIASPSRIVIRGGSAGGLLIGAALSRSPERFAGVVVHDPFADPITALSRPDLPLTVTDWDEWGNPEDVDDYAVLRTISPYETVRSAPFPPVLVTARLQDTRVDYWHTLKWVARLRANTTADAPIACWISDGGGHLGVGSLTSERSELAAVFAFVMACVGVLE